MNQQLIDQLIKLATIRVNNPLLNSDGKVVCDDWQEGVSMSKLIELTVQACLMKANGAKIRGESIGTLIQNIKEDFGVEE